MDSLNEKGKRILKEFLSRKTLTADTLSNILGLSEKTLYGEIDRLNDVLKAHDASIEKKPRVGMWLKAKDDSLNALWLLSEQPERSSLSDIETRKYYLIVRLLEQDDYITMNTLAEEIYVSHGTLVNDIDKVGKWLELHDLSLERKRNKGIRINASEKKRREILAGIYQQHQSNQEMLKVIRELRVGEAPRSIEHYVGSAVFRQFDAFDFDSLKMIVQNLEKKTPIRFSDEGFAAIVIHIAIALKRARDGQFVRLPKDTKQKFMDHKLYPVAKRFVEEVETYFEVSMVEDEASYILMHMLGAKVQDEPEELADAFERPITDTVNAMILQAESLLDVSLINDEILIRSLALHIQSSINRLENHLPIRNPYLEDIKKDYPMVFEASIESFETLRRQYGFPYNDHEIAYIAMHIQAAVERRLANQSQDHYRVLLVCSSGVGTSQLLTSKFKRIFRNLEIVDTVSLSETDAMDLGTIDLIVTTVPFENDDAPIVHVSPFLNQKDLSRIEATLDNLKRDRQNHVKDAFQGFTHLLDETLIRTDVRYTNKDRLLKAMCKVLHDSGYVDEAYYKSVLDREAISSTAVFDFAIPHGDYHFVNQDAMMVWTLNQPIVWDDKPVHAVILLAIRKETTKQLKTFYDTLYGLISDDKLKKTILKTKNPQELYTLLSEGEKT
ncbi:MAG: BglG family transcription antiterminator [Candidatus Izemoplasmataceae bacterium]